MFSFFQKSVPEREYLPDSIYTVCGENTDCGVCSNVVWSPVVNDYVHDTLAGKTLCSFGKNGTMDKQTDQDQRYLTRLEPTKYISTTWGRVPQLDPRPLSKIGLEWRTS